jgi:hypothetical protein
MTDTDLWTIGGATALDMYAPAAAAALHGLVAARPSDLDPGVIAGVRSACSGVTALPSFGPPASAGEAVDPRVIAFAEQFSVDVSSVDDELRAGFAEALGAATFGAAQMVYVADVIPRMCAALDALFGPSEWVAPDAAPVDDTWPVIDVFIQEVARVQVLDAVATELIRVRGARQHECRLCKSRRNITAIREGADDATFDAVDHYETSDLPERIKAALALTDAMIWEPSNIGDTVIASMREQFSPAEAVEIVLDIARNAANKIPVSLASDAPEVTEGIELFDMDVDGNLTYGMTA